MLTSPGQLGGTTSTRYGLYVVTANGKVVRSVTAGIQSIGWHLPRFSVAGRSVYFLDGDTDLKVLRGDGSVADVGRLPGGPADRVVFAVSPDETQIAYSVIHYSSGDTTTTSLRVGPLSTLGGGEIFSGPPIEFPIGWLAGRLVIAITPNGSIQNNGEVNPYFASAYHIVDPITANRVFSTPATCTPQGPVNGGGTICQQVSGTVSAFAWNGTNRVLGPIGYAPPVVLNPDGQSAAATVVTSAIPNQIALVSGGQVTPSAAAGTPAGWFDAIHLLFITGPCCQGTASAAVLDVRSNTVTPVDSALAGTADPFAPFFVPIPNNLS
jgi:hypothetical protein